MWHYSSVEPTIGDITAASSVLDDSPHDIEIKYDTLVDSTSNVTKWSTLSMETPSNERQGYYWCSVNESDNISTANPSMILHIILQELSCKSVRDSSCRGSGEVPLYKHSSTTRCADDVASVDVALAKGCSGQDSMAAPTTVTQPKTALKTTRGPLEVTTEPLASTINRLETMTWNTEQLSTTSSEATQHLVGESEPLNIYIVIGGSTGGVILVLLVFTVCLAVCLLRLRAKHSRRQRVIDEPSPFDDIRMYSTNFNKKGEKADESNRASKLMCESNICYDECPRIAVTHSIDNIYEYIH